MKEMTKKVMTNQVVQVISRLTTAVLSLGASQIDWSTGTHILLFAVAMTISASSFKSHAARIGITAFVMGLTIPYGKSVAPYVVAYLIFGVYMIITFNDRPKVVVSNEK